MSSEAENSIRHHLRSTTSTFHRDVDGRMTEVAPFTSVEGYVRFLGCMLNTFHAFREPLDASSRAAGLEARAAKLCDQARSDLQKLGHRVELSEAALGESSASQAWGVGYSLEGSSLGSRQLLQRVREQLGDETPHSYLAAAAEGGGSRWPTFLQALERANPDPGEAGSGAQSVFRFLLKQLD